MTTALFSDPEVYLTLQDFIAMHGLTMTARPTMRNPNMPDADMSHWRCIIRSPWGSLRAFFSMGRAHTGPPQLDDVLDCLASDAAMVEQVGSFEEWCADLGLDPDSRKEY